MNTIRNSLLLVLLCAAPVFARQAAQPTTHPAWEQLGTAERELLTAPIRERWDSNPEHRAHMLEHARRWQAMTPEQRQGAHRGMKRWARMDPAKRQQTRALFGKMRGMTPEQRKAWIEANPPQPRP